jgi:hypothetical protein
MSYKELLKDVRWQQKRLKIMERDGWACKDAKCPKTSNTMQIHHLDYFPDLKPWEYPDDMLITLCEDCHSKESKRYDLERYLASTLRMKGFLHSDLVALSCLLDTKHSFTQSLLSYLRKMQNG